MTETPRPAATPPDAPKPAADPAKPAPASPAPTGPAGKLPEAKPREIGGPKGPEPTRYGDWEVNGRVSDF